LIIYFWSALVFLGRYTASGILILALFIKTGSPDLLG